MSNFNSEVLRAHLEKMYFEKKLTLEVMQEILAGVRAPTPQMPAPASRPAGPLPPAPIGQRQFASEKIDRPVPTATPSAAILPLRSIESTGFFSSDNIKTLLLSGAALFVLSAYLFVHSYWDSIPAFMKFTALIAMAGGAYGTGWALWRKNKVPKTAETLLGVGLLITPFISYAANVLFLSREWSVPHTWMIGSLTLFIGAALTAMGGVATFGLAALISAGLQGVLYFTGWNFEASGQCLLFLLSAGTLAIGLIALLFQEKIAFQKGFFSSANFSAAFILLAFLANGFYWNAESQTFVVLGFVALGIFYAIQSRVLASEFAYACGLSFMMAGALLLHQFQIPVYKFGLFFVPAGLLAILRAWVFERQGRRELAAPYFHLSQLAVAASIFSGMGPLFHPGDFVVTFLVLMLAIAAYAVMGMLYRNPLFTYAGGLSLFILAGSSVAHYDLAFASGIFWLAATASGMVFLSLATRTISEEQLGIPLFIMGAGILSLMICLMTGKWAAQFVVDGTLVSPIPFGQIVSGIWVGSLGVVSYLLLTVVKRQLEYLYPALASGTLVYFFALQYMNWPVNLWHIAWIVLGCMSLFYFFQGMGWQKLSRPFSLWAQIVLTGVGISAVMSNSPNALLSVGACGAMLVPALVMGSEDLVVSCLLSGYLCHFLWFRNASQAAISDRTLAGYALQLVAVNCGVVFIRTLITAWKPTRSIEPFRVIAVCFSVISLLLSLSDRSIAWQVFLAYGILGILVSLIHYEGRYLGLGTTLLLASYELCLSAHHIELTEAYTVPAAIYLLVWGYLQRDSRDVRNILYGAAQIVLYAPSLEKSVIEVWELHGIFLGVSSVLLMIFGMSQRNRCLTVGSFGVLLLNALIQSHGFFRAVPRWIYLGTGGSLLMALGGIFEFHREWFLRIHRQMADTLDGWD